MAQRETPTNWRRKDLSPGRLDPASTFPCSLHCLSCHILQEPIKDPCPVVSESFTKERPAFSSTWRYFNTTQGWEGRLSQQHHVILVLIAAKLSDSDCFLKSQQNEARG